MTKRELLQRIEALEARVAALEPAMVWTPTVPTVVTNRTTHTATMRCTCPPNRGDSYLGTCPVHDVQVTYTTSLPPPNPTLMGTEYHG